MNFSDMTDEQKRQAMQQVAGNAGYSMAVMHDEINAGLAGQVYTPPEYVNITKPNPGGMDGYNPPGASPLPGTITKPPIFGDIVKPSSSDAASVAGTINAPSLPNTVPGQTVNIVQAAKKTDVATPALIVGAILVLKFWILH